MMVAKAIGEALLSACISMDDWKDQGAGKSRKFTPFDLGWEHTGHLDEDAVEDQIHVCAAIWGIGNRYAVTDGA